MKIEIICYSCGGKVFFNRSSSHRMGWKKDEDSRVITAANWECKRCGNYVRIEHNQNRDTFEAIRNKLYFTGKVTE